MKKIAILLLCIVILLSGCAGTAKPEDALPAGDVWEIIEEAYIYAFPLVLMDATKTSATNTEEPVPGKAPVNQFMHGVALANAQFKNVVSPNVYVIQAGMKLLPLSAYLSEEAYQPPKGSYQEENNYVPVNKVLSLDPGTFFSKANALMESNQPSAVDAELLEKLAAVGVGPGMKFDAAVLTGDVQTSWQEMLQGLRPKLAAEGMKYSNKLGQWSYFGAPIGDFGTEYAYRALVAIAGLGANTVEIALYPKTDKDADGNPLTGEKSYLLHFESDPQVLDGGFWSITAYGDDDFLIDNPIDRYCINDRSGLKRNDDGSVDVILSKDAPADTTNWLPVADGGFHLFMRIYTPDMEALKTWTAPTITAIG